MNIALMDGVPRIVTAAITTAIGDNLSPAVCCR